MPRIEQYVTTQGSDRRVFEDDLKALNWAIQAVRADKPVELRMPDGDEYLLIKRSHQYRINLTREL